MVRRPVGTELECPCEQMLCLIGKAVNRHLEVEEIGESQCSGTADRTLKPGPVRPERIRCSERVSAGGRSGFRFSACGPNMRAAEIRRGTGPHVMLKEQIGFENRT